MSNLIFSRGCRLSSRFIQSAVIAALVLIGGTTTSDCISRCIIQEACGQALQLPTFGYSGVATTVSVPDRGGVIMGGVTTSSSSYNESGAPLSPFRNRAWGRSTTANTYSAHVYVHDFEAMDAELLGTPDVAGSSQAVVRNGSRSIPVRLTSTEAARELSDRKASTAVTVQKRPRTGSSNAPQAFFLSGNRDLSDVATRVATRRVSVEAAEQTENQSIQFNPADNQTVIQASKFNE